MRSIPDFERPGSPLHRGWHPRPDDWQQSKNPPPLLRQGEDDLEKANLQGGMPRWPGASRRDHKKREAIAQVLKRYPGRMAQMFHPSEPSLRASPQSLMRGVPENERLLIGIAFDLWISGLAGIQVSELQSLDTESFESVIAALQLLRSP